MITNHPRAYKEFPVHWDSIVGKPAGLGSGSVGPEGPQGPPGDDGAIGEQGDVGDAGSQGLSAYEVAVTEAFIGTEAEWLASLIGPEGPAGNDGNDGAAGAQGLPGADGDDGADGSDGATGPPGTTNYNDLTNKPTLGTAAATAIGDYATAAQGVKADSAVQPAGLTKAAVGLGNADNTSDANKPVSSAQQTALNAKEATANKGAASGYCDLDSGSKVPTAKLPVVPFANGGEEGSAATSATTGTMTVNMTTAVITITPTGACTFNASGGRAGATATFIITTAGVSSFVLTFGTNFRKTGTLATGTVSARFFAVTFRCVNGTIWQEIARTIVQT